MHSVQHPTSNRVLGAPPGAERMCDGLPVRDDRTNCGMPLVVSHWRPSLQELAILNAGGLVTLTVVGAMHPMVAIGVEESE